jgi:hypothetical protein
LEDKGDGRKPPIVEKRLLNWLRMMMIMMNLQVLLPVSNSNKIDLYYECLKMHMVKQNEENAGLQVMCCR